MATFAEYCLKLLRVMKTMTYWSLFAIAGFIKTLAAMEAVGQLDKKAAQCVVFINWVEVATRELVRLFSAECRVGGYAGRGGWQGACQP